MKCAMVLAAAMAAAMACGARTVETGTFVANAGATVVVPVTISDMGGFAAASVAINYDPTVVVCLGAQPGSAVAADGMTYLDSGSGQLVAVFSGFTRDAGRGELLKVVFSVRDGTQGLYSDVTLADVQLGASDGVSDLTAGDPLKTVNGMIRVMAADAAVSRLEEAFTVCPGTTVKTLALAAGDRLMASDDGAAIAATESVVAAGAIPVAAPPGGWQSGRVALLATPTAGLAFSFPDFESGTEGNAIAIGTETANGVTTYWADVTVAGEVKIVAESGTLDAGTVAQIRGALADALAKHPEVARVTVKGDMAAIPAIAGLGIGPKFDVSGTTATAAYAMPMVSIIAFEPATGRVRIKVTPGEGNTIRTAFATGCIHVYGTADLREKMRYISGTSFDLTPYLKEDTKGEADLGVSLGTHTFIKIKVETTTKQEGELE